MTFIEVLDDYEGRKIVPSLSPLPLLREISTLKT